MKMKDMTLEQWQVRLEQFKRENWNSKPNAAFRIDGTPFSTARHYGAFTFNGETYTVFYFSGGAMIGARMDFMKWLGKKLQDEKKEGAKK